MSATNANADTLQETLGWFESYLDSVAPSVFGEDEGDSAPFLENFLDESEALFANSLAPREPGDQQSIDSTSKEAFTPPREGERNKEVEIEQDEVKRLFVYRRVIEQTLERNASLQKLLRSAVITAGDARKEVQLCTHQLSSAQTLQQRETQPDVFVIHSTSTKIPLFPDIYKEIPLLAFQDQEIEEVRLLTSEHVPWSATECDKLKQSVLRLCKRIVARKLAASRRCENPLAMLEELSEEELAIVSIPKISQGNEGKEEERDEEIDWDEVSEELNFNHTGDECRTRWMMWESPFTSRKREWNSDEKAKLEEAVQRNGDMESNNIHWQKVAYELGGGRSPTECFVNWQRHDANPINLPKIPVYFENEDRVMQELDRIWGHRAVIVAEKLGTSRTRQQIHAHLRHLYQKQEEEEQAMGPRRGQEVAGLRKRPPVVRRWSRADDSNLLNTLETRPLRYWRDVEHYVEGRSFKGCYKRWIAMVTKSEKGEPVSGSVSIAERVKRLRKRMESGELSHLAGGKPASIIDEAGNEAESEDFEESLQPTKKRKKANISKKRGRVQISSGRDVVDGRNDNDGVKEIAFSRMSVSPTREPRPPC